MNRAVTVLELLLIAGIVLALYLFGRQLWAALTKGWGGIKAANDAVNGWVGQAPGGVDENGNIVPYPNPKTTAEELANQAAAGVTRPDTGTGFES